MMSKINKGGLMTWLILGILGVLLILGQQFIKDVMYIVMAIGLILAALASIWAWWKEKSTSKDAITTLLGSILLLIIGIWILTHASTFDAIINLSIGIILIVSGIRWFYRGWKIFDDRLMMVLSVIEILLGIFIACTGVATGWPIIVEGAGLIYTALTGFIAEKRFVQA